MLTAVNRKNLATWAKPKSSPKKPAFRPQGPRDEYAGTRSGEPSLMKKQSFFSKETKRKAGYALTTAWSVGLGAAFGAVPGLGILTNMSNGVRAGRILSTEPGPGATLGVAGFVANLVGMGAVGVTGSLVATSAIVPLAVSGVIGGVCGSIIGKFNAEREFGKWSKG